MSKIKIEGKEYKVIENLGFQGGHYAKVLIVDNEEKVAIKAHGGWRFWTINDRIGRRYVNKRTP